MSELPIFSYAQGRSFVHRMPSWVKILAVPALNILLFSLDWRISACFIPAFALLSLSIGFSVRAILRDLKPALYYGAFLYLMNFLVLSCSLLSVAFSGAEDGSSNGGWRLLAVGSLRVLKIAFLDSVADVSTLGFCLRFCACVQSCSVLFGTSSSVQIRMGVESIEVFLRRFLPFGKEPRFALAVSMLVVFIPTVFKIWARLCRAWRARGGRSSPKMFLVLLPQLFSVGLRSASETAKSLMNRM